MRARWINAGLALLLVVSAWPARAALEPETQPGVRVGIMLFDGVLLVPGGSIGEAEKHPKVLSFVRAQAADSRHVLSVCTGSFILASAVAAAVQCHLGDARRGAAAAHPRGHGQSGRVVAGGWRGPLDP